MAAACELDEPLRSARYWWGRSLTSRMTRTPHWYRPSASSTGRPLASKRRRAPLPSIAVNSMLNDSPRVARLKWSVPIAKHPLIGCVGKERCPRTVNGENCVADAGKNGGELRALVFAGAREVLQLDTARVEIVIRRVEFLDGGLQLLVERL